VSIRAPAIRGGACGPQSALGLGLTGANREHVRGARVWAAVCGPPDVCALHTPHAQWEMRITKPCACATPYATTLRWSPPSTQAHSLQRARIHLPDPQRAHGVPSLKHGDCKARGAHARCFSVPSTQRHASAHPATLPSPCATPHGPLPLVAHSCGRVCGPRRVEMPEQSAESGWWR